MLKQKHFALSIALLLATGLSCDVVTAPATHGSIDIVLLSPSGAQLSVAPRGTDGVAESNVDLSGSLAGNSANVLLDGVRVTVTGPTSKSLTVTTATGGFFQVTVDELLPGSYTVVVEGLVGGKVGHYGETTSINVTAGATASAPVTFPVFQPVVPGITVTDTFDVLRFTVSYQPVASATSYTVEWSTSPTMAGAQNKSVTATTTDVSVPAEGTYYFTVRAVNSTVGSTGLPSPPKPVLVFQGVATVTVTPATPAPISVGATQQFTAEARDGDNVVVPNVQWFWSSSNQAAATVNQLGLVTGVGGGATIITALGKGTPGSVNQTVTVLPATTLAFIVQPSNTTAGVAMSSAVQVEVRDAQGNRAIGSSAAITVAIGTNPNSGTLSGTKTVNAINGLASFSGLSIDKAGTGYTLTAASGVLTNSPSSGFDISAGTAAKLAFATQPLSSPIVRAFDPFEVVVQDAFGNLVQSASNEITLELAPNAGNAIAVGQTSEIANQGSAVFATIGVNEIGTGLRFIASSPGMVSATSETFSGMLRAYLVNTSNATVSVLEASDNSHVTDIPVGSFPTQIAISPDGTRGYVTNFSGASVTVLDLTDNTVVTTVTVGAGPQGVAVSPDGAWVYVANSSGNSVSVINTSNNTASAPIVVGTFPIGVAFTPDGLKAFVVNQNSNSVTIFNATTHAIITTVPTGVVAGDPRNIAISPDGAVAYVTNSSTDQVTVFRVQNNTVITSVPVGDSPIGVVFSPDGRFAYVVSAASRSVAVVANGGLTTTHNVIDWVPIGAGARKIALTPGGSFVYVANQSGSSVTVINTVTRSVVTTLLPADGYPFNQPWGVKFRP